MLTQSALRDKVYLFLGIITGIVLFGIAGYMIIEGWSFVDSLYMTTITISTVGYSEVNGLSFAGKIFTIILIIISFGNFAFAITSLTRYVVEGEYKRDLRDLKVKRNLKNMVGHVIVAGYGRVGKQVAEDLIEQHRKVVVIENDIHVVEQNENNVKFQFMPGNSTKDEVLLGAGLEKASAIVTCLPNDADNLYIVLAAREYNKTIQIVARASNVEAVAKLKMAGATHVVMPDSIGGTHMATLIANPHVADFLDLISATGESEVNIECIEFDEIPAEFHNTRIGTLRVKELTGANIVGYLGEDGDYVINPTSEIEIAKGSKIFVLGTKEQIRSLHNCFNFELKK
jgi:voltage-gated potassium channel